MAELIAQFNSSIRTGVAPLTVNFTNTSSGPYTSVVWDFGDGSQSTEINPTHQFLRDGVYQVSLTILDSSSGQSVTRDVITVFAESSQSASTVQQALYVAKRFLPGQVQIKRESTTGSTFESSYPYSADGSLNLNSGGVFELGIIGSETFYGTILNSVYYSAGTLDYEDFHTFITGNATDVAFSGWMAVMWGGPTGNTNPARWDTVFDGSASPKQVNWFRIRSIDTGSTPTVSGGPITIDHIGPRWPRDTVDPDGLITAVVFITHTASTHSAATFISSDNNWLHTNIGVDSYDDFEITTGLTYIDNSFAGTINYAGLNKYSGQTATISTLPYSGYEASDRFYPGTFYYSIPWVMWHKSQTPGIKMYDYAGSVQKDGNTGQRFKYLRDGLAESDNIVGKIYYDKKAIVITDQELNAALNTTSNRSWTLPQPRISVNGTGGNNPGGIKYYITYWTQDTGATLSQGLFTYGAEDRGKPMHCKYIQTVTPTESGETFSMYAEDSPWRTTDYAGTGFVQHEIYILVGTGSTNSTHATETSWYYSGMGVASLSGTVNIPDYPDLVTANNLRSAHWDDGTSPVNNEWMPFGSQEIGLGYMSGHFESTTYKMAATCVGKHNEFNATQNPTFNNYRTNENIYITEVALYNEKNELLMVGKLNKPIKKNDERYVTIRVELDL